MPEYKLGAGIADYALLGSGKPAMMIEAKRLGANLQSAASQGITYCIADGIEYFTVSDGRRWEIYETHRPVPIDEKMVVSFDLLGMATAEVCLKAMALWRSAVQDGKVSTAESPLVKVEAEETPRAIPAYPAAVIQPKPQLAESKTFNVANSTTRDSPDTSNWVPLSDLSPQGGDIPPVEIQFPDNSRVALGRWNLVVVESARWLYTNNYLNASNSRVQRATRYIVSDAPIHPNGKEFTMPSNVGSLYVEINYSGLNHVKNSRIIIEHAGQDPAQFKVRLSS